jgi:TolB-like protein/class 3 adenylate cyclase
MTPTAVRSRTLTLVFTDLADSTALKAKRGDQAVGDLIQRHRSIVRRLASECDGRVIDWAGDGCFLTFETPSAAVTFSLLLHRAHLETPDLPALRTGIHIGEVSEWPADGDATPRVEGLAVDLAARIASLAHPQQLLMSAAVADSARQRIDTGAFREPLRWEAHGRYVLKGFEEPLELREAGFEDLTLFAAPIATEKAWPASSFRSARPIHRRAPAVAAGSIVLVALLVYLGWPFGSELRGGPADVPDFDGRPAIAVLPFDNLSPDPDQAFFADGLAEDLITRLASWRAFPVIARNSSFQYRGGGLDLKRVGAELGARYLVEGSVRRVGDRIRVTAQLIDASSAEHVWAETYDRAVADVFSLQDEIGSTIAASLVGDLTRAEGERARQQGTESLEAWSLYQLGLQHAARYTARDAHEAVRLFERALELDPYFSTAQARLAMAKWMSAPGEGHAATDEEVAAALEAARRAVELDPRDPVAHAALASAYLTAGDPRSAIDAARKAVDLNPSMPEAWIWLGWAQVLAGDPEACIAATVRARELDPQGSMVWIHDSLALANWEAGRYEAALEEGRRLVALHPEYLTGHLYVAMSAVSLGRIDEARAAIAAGRRARPDLSIELMQNYLVVSRPAIDARRNAALRKAGLD